MEVERKCSNCATLSPEESLTNHGYVGTCGNSESMYFDEIVTSNNRCGVFVDIKKES